MENTEHEATETVEMTDVEVTEDTSDMWKKKGDDFYRSKSYHNAIDAYTNAINSQVGSNANFYSNRSAAYMMIGSYQEALKDSDVALAIEPSSKICFRRATTLKSLGRYDDAIKSLTDGLVIDPTSMTAKSEMESLVLLKKRIEGLHTRVSNKQYRMVLPEIEAVLKIAGSKVREINLLKAVVLLELERSPEAYSLTNTMMKESGSNADFELICLRARCLYASGDLENAIKHLQQSLRLDPDSKPSREFLKKIRGVEEKREGGKVAFKAGEYQNSINLWTECINLDNQNKAVVTTLYCNRAAAYAYLEDHAKAIKDCTSALALNPQYGKAYIRRADSSFFLGGKDNLQKSMNDYQKALDLENEEKNMESIKTKLKRAKVAHKRSGKKDLYATLGVTSAASEDEIKKGYRKAALKYHPDKNAAKSDEEKVESEKMFREVGEAYEILTDPEKKKNYDEGVDVEDLDRPGCGGGHGGGHGMHGSGGIDHSMLFQMFMQQHMHGRG